MKKNTHNTIVILLLVLAAFAVGSLRAQEVNVDSLLTVKMAELEARWELYKVEQAKVTYAHKEFKAFQESLKPKEVEAEDE